MKHIVQAQADAHQPLPLFLQPSGAAEEKASSPAPASDGLFKPEASGTMLDIATAFRGVEFGSKPNPGKEFFFYEEVDDTIVYRKAHDHLHVDGVRRV